MAYGLATRERHLTAEAVYNVSDALLTAVRANALAIDRKLLEHEPGSSVEGEIGAHLLHMHDLLVALNHVLRPAVPADDELPG